MTIVEFLRARLDEEEAIARAAGNRKWLVQDEIIELWPEDEFDGRMIWPTRADARHAATWEPARVLADLEAKRQVLEECEGQGYVHEGPIPRSAVPPEAPMSWPILANMAAVYSNHPDYDPAWRPG